MEKKDQEGPRAQAIKGSVFKTRTDEIEQDFETGGR